MPGASAVYPQNNPTVTVPTRGQAWGLRWSPSVKRKLLPGVVANTPQENLIVMGHTQNYLRLMVTVQVFRIQDSE